MDDSKPETPSPRRVSHHVVFTVELDNVDSEELKDRLRDKVRDAVAWIKVEYPTETIKLHYTAFVMSSEGIELL